MKKFLTGFLEKNTAAVSIGTRPAESLIPAPASMTSFKREPRNLADAGHERNLRKREMHRLNLRTAYISS